MVADFVIPQMAQVLCRYFFILLYFALQFYYKLKV
jgi:hypothetical protein